MMVMLTHEQGGAFAVNPAHVLYCLAASETVVAVTFSDNRTLKVQGTLEEVVGLIDPVPTEEPAL